MGRSSIYAEETIDIENSGNAVMLRLGPRTLASIYIEGDASATYQWDGRRIGGTWKQNIGPEYSGSSNYDDTVETGWAEVRLRCSSGTGSSSDQADIVISAGGH